MKNKKLLFFVIGVSIIIYTLAYTLYYFEYKTNNDDNSNNVVDIKEDIIYREIDDYEDIVETLQYKNYSTEEINNILGHLSDTNIKTLINMDYYDLKDYLEITNFNIANIDRYINFKTSNPDIDYKDIVTKVNLNLDKEFYSTTTVVKDLDNINILVNKYNSLPEDYEPKDLTSLSYNSKYKLRKEAADAFEKITAAAKTENISFYPYSAFRSYDSQKIIYNRYVNKDGVNKANTYSAKPGNSEHQTGLAVDIRSTGYNELINSHYKWLQNNSYKYGFIIRYTKDNESITGYQEEPWHLRYIGINNATKIHELNITYDEYYDLYIKTY